MRVLGYNLTEGQVQRLLVVGLRYRANLLSCIWRKPSSSAEHLHLVFPDLPVNTDCAE